MANEERLDTLIEKAFEYRRNNTPLKELIAKEHLETYQLGYEDIIYAMDLDTAIVPCGKYMILAYDRYDKDNKAMVAEYAIYEQYCKSGILYDSLNMEAEYRLVCVWDKTFPNMAKAICHATEVIERK